MELYPHQEAAVEWLRRTPRAGFFDDQGLGKTISALVAARDKTITIVCPTAVLGNWKREAELWLGLPDIDVQVLDKKSSRIRGHPRVVITTHGLIRDPWIAAQLEYQANDVLICDEAQFMRSRKALCTRVFYDVLAPKAKQVWMLTGTPMPSWPTDLWAMGKHLWADEFPETFEQFREKFCVLAPSDYGDGVRVVGTQNLGELRRRLSGVTLRRMKTQELDLPPLRSEQIYLDAPPIRELEELHEMLSAQARLDLDKLDTSEEQLEAVLQHVDLARYRRLCGEAKVAPLANMLTLELDADTSCKRVIFCHHVGVALQLMRAFEDYHPVRVTGDVSSRQRTLNVDRFQNDPQCRVIVCQIVAGGTGITLTAADDITFCEMSFVPGEIMQAVDRIYRIGQDKPCRVRFASLRGSVDELMTRVLQRKVAAIRQVLK